MMGAGEDFHDALIALLPKLRRFALGLTSSTADAEDLVQSAVERALKHAHAWTPGSRLDSWMYRIIQNLWRDELRAHRRRAAPLDEALDIAGEDGRITAETRREAADAAAAVAALPEEQKAVFMLVAVQGVSYRDAAQILNAPVGTIMSRLARARRAIAGKLFPAKLFDDAQS